MTRPSQAQTSVVTRRVDRAHQAVVSTVPKLKRSSVEPAAEIASAASDERDSRITVLLSIRPS